MMTHTIEPILAIVIMHKPYIHNKNLSIRSSEITALVIQKQV